MLIKKILSQSILIKQFYGSLLVLYALTYVFSSVYTSIINTFCLKIIGKMFKVISIIICMTICSEYQIDSAIAHNKDGIKTQNQTLLADSSFFNRNDARSENLTKILIFAGLISVVGFTGWQISRQSHSGKTRPNYRHGKRSNKALIDRVSPKLRRQLLRLINDPKTANRLLMGIQKHHGDRDPDWLAEKVIYDLRRGR